MLCDAVLIAAGQADTPLREQPLPQTLLLCYTGPKAGGRISVTGAAHLLRRGRICRAWERRGGGCADDAAAQGVRQPQSRGRWLLPRTGAGSTAGRGRCLVRRARAPLHVVRYRRETRQGIQEVIP